MVDHTRKCSDKYKVFIILNLTNLELLIMPLIYLTFEEKLLSKITGRLYRAGLPT